MLETISKISTGVCTVKAISFFIGAFILFIVSIVLVFIPTNDRQIVTVKVTSSDSSHELTDKEVQADTNERIVRATRVNDTSVETCENDSCTCSGYVYEYFDENNVRFTATCPGHAGRCDIDSTKNLIWNSSTLQLKCQDANKLEYEFNSADESIKNMMCAHAPIDNNPVTLTFVKNKTTNEMSCPTNGKWNTCTQTLSYNSQNYDFTKHTSERCENELNTTKQMYYSSETNDLTDEYTNSGLALKIAAVVCIIISIILCVNGYFLLKSPTFCHVSNVSDAVSGVRRRSDRIRLRQPSNPTTRVF